MKRQVALSLILLAIVAGCRNNGGPTMDPFLRTRVPPPGTGAAAPGAYAPGAPGAPPPAAAPAPMTPVAPPDKFNPSGGWSNFQQSSTERPKTPEEDIADAAADAPEIMAWNESPAAARAASSSTPSLPGKARADLANTTAASGVSSDAMPDKNVQPVVFRAASPTVTKPPIPAALPLEKDEPRQVADTTSDEPRASNSSIRILPPGETASEPAAAEVTQTEDVATESAARFVSSKKPSATTATGDAASGGQYAHDATYHTLSGKLEYLEASRQWKLRYIPIDGQTDSYGGSVVLNDTPALGKFQPGDFVSVQGVISGEQPASRGFSPFYTIREIGRATL